MNKKILIIAPFFFPSIGGIEEQTKTLGENFIKKGYEVHGIKRRSSSFNTKRIDHLYQDSHDTNSRFKLYYGDLTDSANLIKLITEIKPDEIYNLAAQSHVAVSFDIPEYTSNTD